MDKFDWQASESAPINYPMQIVSGSFFYHDGSGSLYVPDKATLDHGWGTGRSSHIVGPDLKPLPSRLGIVFFSYTENQFYLGKFDLPYDKILKLFQEGYYSYTQEKHITYRKIVVGIAPGGAVAVWLVGINKTTEVFFGQAEKADTDWGALTGATHISREEYVRLAIQESLTGPEGFRIEDPQKQQEALEVLRKKGIPFGLWNTYRTRYAWQPLFTNMPLRGGRTNMIKYFNGEEDFLPYPLDKTAAASTRAVPKQLDFVWMPPGAAKGRSIKLYFNEAEILDAFKKLGANNQPLQLEMRIDVIDGKKDFTIWLRNDKDKIELKRTEIKNYGT